jgi:hypothetical protein
VIGLENIGKVIELCLWSAHIKDEQPVSALITSLVEAGKTDLLMKYADNEGCVVLSDVTAFGIMRDYRDQIISRKLRHIIIPDLIKPMSRGKDTVHSFVAFLNGLIEEGVLNISTYAEKITVKYDSKKNPIPIKCGLITTMAKDVLLDGRHHWANMGFMSRLIPISYEYNVTTKLGIHKSIAGRQYHDEKKVKLDFPSEDVAIVLPQNLAEDLVNLAVALSVSTKERPEKVYGFRLQKNLQRLAMANALSEGRDTVNEHDIGVIQGLAKHINLDYTQI